MPRPETVTTGDHAEGSARGGGGPGRPGTGVPPGGRGASGTIFSHVIDALVQAGGMPLPDALSRAASRIMQIGMARAGDKTMLDALIPAAAASDAAGAARAARAGAEATRTLVARRGRARHVEGAGVGHLDAGAVSVAEILELYAGHAT